MGPGRSAGRPGETKPIGSTPAAKRTQPPRRPRPAVPSQTKPAGPGPRRAYPRTARDREAESTKRTQSRSALPGEPPPREDGTPRETIFVGAAFEHTSSRKSRRAEGGGCLPRFRAFEGGGWVESSRPTGSTSPGAGSVGGPSIDDPGRVGRPGSFRRRIWWASKTRPALHAGRDREGHRRGGLRGRTRRGGRGGRRPSRGIRRRRPSRPRPRRRRPSGRGRRRRRRSGSFRRGGRCGR